ncbi:hypothetical protein Tco_0462046 [Tanacetum coccineum]
MSWPRESQERVLCEVLLKENMMCVICKYKPLYTQHELVKITIEYQDQVKHGEGIKEKENGQILVMKKRKLDDEDRDEDPPARPDQGLKRRKTSKFVEPSKRSKSTSSSKGKTSSQPKPKSTGTTNEQPNGEDASKNDWFKKPKRPPSHVPEWNEGKSVDNEPTVPKHDVYSTMRILAVTNVKVNKWYGYGHLETYCHSKKSRRSSTRRRKLPKEAQHLQAKNTFRRAPYTSLSDPQGVIYKDKLNKKRLMRSDELHKFSDVMPRRKWSNLDKKRSHIMVKDIDRQLLERRLMRSLEKFFGGREYEDDLRDLPRDIPLDRIEVLRYDAKGVKVRKGIMQTKTELTLEQTQQGISDEVLVKCKYETRNTGNGPKNEGNTDSYETLQHYGVTWTLDYAVTSFKLARWKVHVSSLWHKPLKGYAVTYLKSINRGLIQTIQHQPFHHSSKKRPRLLYLEKFNQKSKGDHT